MAQIGSAGSPLDIKLRQTTSIKNSPSLAYETQLILNSVHLLNQYLEVLREALEGADAQDPSESMQFRRFLFGVAGQDIPVGSVCSFDGNLVVKGVGTTGPNGTSWLETSEPLGGTGTRAFFGLQDTQFYIALEAKAVGEIVKLGVPAGVIKLTGAKCGNLVWGAGARSIYHTRRVNTNIQNLRDRPLTGEGGIFLSNPLGKQTDPPGTSGNNWEGYWMPGFPYRSGNEDQYNRNFLYPIGICILDGYALINPRIYSPSLPAVWIIT